MTSAYTILPPQVIALFVSGHGGDIKNVTEGYRAASSRGQAPESVGLPFFATQQDHDSYHPDDAGTDFQGFNEVASAIQRGLQANNVPATLVTIRYPEYLEWLKGRRNTSNERAAYCGYCVALQAVNSNSLSPTE